MAALRVDRLTPLDARVGVDREHGRVLEVEVDVGAALVERRLRDDAEGVTLERAGHRDGVADEGLEGLRAEVAGVVGRVAPVDVETDAQAAALALLELLDLAVADLHLDAAAARRAREDVIGACRARHADRVADPVLELTKHFRLRP